MDAEDELPYSVQMDQADARELVQSGAFLLALDVPPGTSFGFNTQMFVLGPHFKGLKMLLPGPHFVYYSAKSRHGGDSSPVTGFFLHLSPAQVAVRQWNPDEERLVKLEDRSEEERYELGARNMEFDRQLAPYNIGHHKAWQLLTNFISPDVISRIEPVDGNISVMAESALLQHAAKTPGERRLYEQISKGRTTLSQESNDNGASTSEELTRVDKRSSGRCFYTHLPHIVKQAGISASELTALHMDKTQILEQVLEKEYGGQEALLLGELQFSFVAFLMGQSLESFGQWKGIVSLLLRCEDAPLRTRTMLYIKFLRVIYWQIRQSLKPDARSSNSSTETLVLLDNGWLSEDNFFRLLLKEFFEMLWDATPVNGDLLRQAKRLKKLVEEIVGWSFGADQPDGEEDNEYAPVIVYE